MDNILILLTIIAGLLVIFACLSCINREKLKEKEKLKEQLKVAQQEKYFVSGGIVNLQSSALIASMENLLYERINSPGYASQHIYKTTKGNYVLFSFIPPKNSYCEIIDEAKAKQLVLDWCVDSFKNHFGEPEIL